MTELSFQERCARWHQTRYPDRTVDQIFVKLVEELVEAIVTEVEDAGFARQVRVPWVLDEIDLANLARGGTLWLTCLGELPAHYLHVQPPHSAGASG